MSTRLGSLLLLLFAVLLFVPAVSQQTSLQNQIAQRVDAREQRISQVATPPAPDTKTARLQELQQDVIALSTLSASVQSDLQQLQKGFLVKDLNENLKKMEKLSKKLRREVE
jgi:hypothetical protein